MESPEQIIDKAFQYGLTPTPNWEECLLESAPMLCRHGVGAVAVERREAWRRRPLAVAFAQQHAELLREAMPAPAGADTHALPGVVLRGDPASQALFCRTHAGEKPGYPRVHGSNRDKSVTHPRVWDHRGARRDNGSLGPSARGHVGGCWSRPIEGTPAGTVTIRRE